MKNNKYLGIIAEAVKENHMATYKASNAYSHARKHNGVVIQMISPPYYLATKLEAFLDALPSHLHPDAVSPARIKII